ncbi:hypothetical protein BG846_04852 [Streptomyces fradiae ATCC 10745 = DSM 40063]|uniref:Uncharacterized protein n=1 Tax=Streptomyces fradiae ATCC 10745 = DSM 40063 TaxID=1319510 RepID=A0A1Y2NRJ0_STRFR|nr:hypothetical protein BG846_04852 [Streptomyces fradiae ATCC 10745 = DSM 40063]
MAGRGGQRGDGGRPQDQGPAHPHRHERRHDRGQGAAGRQPGLGQRGQGEGQEAEAQHPARPVAVDETAHEGGEHRHGGGAGKQQQAGGVPVEAADGVQVQRCQEEDDAVEEGQREVGRDGGQEGPLPEQPEPDQRVAGTGLHRAQPAEGGATAQEEGEGARRRPSPQVPQGQRQDEAGHGQAEQRQTGPVHPAGHPLPVGLRHGGDAHRERRRDERHVQPEDPGPPRRPDEEAAQDRAQGQAEPVDPVEAADRPAPPLRREDRRDEGTGRGVQHRAGGSLEEAGGDQPSRCGCAPGAQGGRGEDDGPGVQDLPAAVPVGEPARRHHAGGQRDDEGVHDQLQFGDRRPEVLLHDRRDRAHDGQVDAAEKAQRAQTRESPPGAYRRGAVAGHAAPFLVRPTFREVNRRRRRRVDGYTEKA